MKRSLIPAALLSLAIGSYAQKPADPPSATHPEKIAIMSLQGALVGTTDGQAANKKLTAEFEPKKKAFDARRAQIQQEEQQLQKSANVMSAQKRADEQRKIDDDKRMLQRDMQDAKEDLQNEQQQILQKLGQRLMAVISKYAKDNGYTMVLDDSNPSNPILYAATDTDITRDIIALYNKTTANEGPIDVPHAPGSSSKPATPGTPAPGK
ncbi:MAG TPA: OmpH family outer membrane protein [Bryobacteraceae bacterium]